MVRLRCLPAIGIFDAVDVCCHPFIHIEWLIHLSYVVVNEDIVDLTNSIETVIQDVDDGDGV